MKNVINMFEITGYLKLCYECILVFTYASPHASSSSSLCISSFLVHQFFEDAVQAISNFNLQNLSLLQQGIHNQLLQGARRLCRRCGQPPAQAKFMAYDMGLTGDFKCTFIQHHMWPSHILRHTIASTKLHFLCRDYAFLSFNLDFPLPLST